MQSGINHYFNLLALDPTIFKVFYEFEGSAGTTVPSISGADSLFAGTLNSTVGFYNIPGRGRFNGSINLRVTNETGLFAPDWTMMFVFEKITSDHGVLFSCYHGNAIKSGFAIGVNNANKIYFETYSDEGPRVLEADLRLAAHNAVAVTKAGDGVYFSLFDMNSKTVEAESFAVDSRYVLDSTGWYLGDAVDAPTYFSGAPFRGYIDSFLYFNAPLMPYQLERMFSGFYASGTGANVSYANTFGFDGISFTEPVTADDFIEFISFPTGYDKLSVNRTAIFDRAYGDFLLLEETPQERLNPYLNGAAQIPSGYSISGDLYNQSFALSGDFFVSGQEVVSNGFHTADDNLLYDVVSGVRGLVRVPQSYVGNTLEISAQNSHVFLNGVKLRSGIDYTVTSNTQITVANANLTGISGVVFAFPIDNDNYYRTSGTFNSATGERFARGTSQVWRNGLRQAHGINYVEVSKVDLLLGSGTFIESPTILNNEELFWR